ncbi:hypothetical protein IWQ60_010699 [Tieghemiomyces parasiticus]|uniref:Plectin/eS10 N-terminal domain-containing protein n=1 Tax=Tieghemiomyces parasiticus TaxID=78921 RepID=A0A9W8DN80_9FUNG|nr:hypothetical protein IWQ60_010699 [Tieghemiomyces parasiticus]
MLMPQQNRRVIYEALFKDGVLVAQKDFNKPKHDELDVPNLHVIKAMQSLASRGYVSTLFSWQYYYYTLTDEGIEYLREYLHLPADVFPSTFKKAVRAAAPRFSGRDREGFRPRGEREEYRRDDGAKKEGAAGDFKPEFRGGFGRGRAPQ